MLIPVNINLLGQAQPPARKLPPQLVQFGTDELMLLELQGGLEVEGSKDGQLVGKLKVDPESKKPTLMIGYHLLEGKLVNLPKPLAVLHRRDSLPSGDDDADGMDVDEEGAGGAPGPLSSQRATGWDIVAVVKRKMVFAKRPTPIVGMGSEKPPSSRVGGKT
ncbi:Ctf8-domain-containing protein [Epithele typhae]|uniref:Ctf8-domain-containing protein n=1 Tax=Epithele typhae TaxID=378194 RepID=UPI0020080332|nr:Ctf8-domain-containing protein [Epithele typhae]KAH9943033.1 Ctf8-domain-containing protein [Epithele typhae]